MKKIFTLFAAAAMTALAAQAQDSFTFYHGEQALESGASYAVGYIYNADDELYNWDAELNIQFNYAMSGFVYEVTPTATVQTCPEFPGTAPGTCFIAPANETKVIDNFKSVDFSEGAKCSLGLHLVDQDEIPEEVIVVNVRAYEDGWEDEAIDVTVNFGLFDQASITVEKVNDTYVRPSGKNLNYNLDKAVTLKVYDMTGRQVLATSVSGNGSVSLASLPQGIYLYRAGTITGKAMIR